MEADHPKTLTFLHFNDAYHIEPNKQGKSERIEYAFINDHNFRL